jgi:hypothetical protein
MGDSFFAPDLAHLLVTMIKKKRIKTMHNSIKYGLMATPTADHII